MLLNDCHAGRACLALIFFFFLISSCKKGFDKYYDDESPKGGYVFDKIKSNTNFSLFAQGLERADIVRYINNGGSWTVFAPTNEAITAFLNANGYATINDVPIDRLFSILSFHVVNNMWYYYDLQQRYITYQQKLYLTRNKKFVNIDVTAPDTIKVNGIPTIKSLRDIDADNGVIHGIGTVLIPLNNLEQLLQADPQLKNSTFYRLMQVVADSAFDRFNSYDRDRDGRLDSVFYKVYPLLDNVNTSIEFKQNTAPENQGGDPVFNTVLIPSNDSLNLFLTPALDRIPSTVPDKIAALTPAYAEAVLESYFKYDTTGAFSSAMLITRTGNIRSVNNELIPATPDIEFLRKDLIASNGIVHVVDMTFPRSERLRSAIGQAMLDPELSSFMAALQQAGLLGSLATITRAGTYFAPTNAAFAAAGLDIKKRTLNGVSLTATQFSNIMRGHVIDQNLQITGLTGTINTNIGAGYTLVFTNGGTTVTSSDGVIATVTHPEVSRGPSNVGFVYKVDKVLIPKP
jgi:uncharacterized surface protein with fasciclin (FAS1) repeats